MIITDERERLIRECDDRRRIIGEVRNLIEKMRNKEYYYRCMMIDYDKEIEKNEEYIQRGIVVLEERTKVLKERFETAYDIDNGILEVDKSC